MHAPTAARLALAFLAPLALAAQSPRSFTTTLSVADLAQKHALWQDAHHIRPAPLEHIDVPMLDIYSPSGVLLYLRGLHPA